MFSKKTIFKQPDARGAILKTSVVLYASSLLNDSEIYAKALSEINAQLEKEPHNSRKAWMLGRLLLAKKNKIDHMKGEMKDKTVDEETRLELEKLEKDIEATRNQLKNLLNSDIANDKMRAWALGYLAALDLEEYQINKEEMIKAANALTESSDALWADVMNLQAAARAHDEPTFELILKQMQQFTGKETVAEALAQIPADDWRAWAMGMVSESAALMGDVKLYQELNQPLSAATHEAVSKESTANAMLAQISADTAEKLMQPHQTRAVNRQ